jgi:phthalate 4,5-dioxygenase
MVLHVDVVTFRSKANRANNYLLDREMQRRDNFTGIDGINVQDRALQESMGELLTARRSIWGRPTRQSSRRENCC